MSTYSKIRITLLEEMLGTKAANPEVFKTFIASKAPDGDKRKEELETAENREEAGTTIFHSANGQPGIWDYQLKGFFKDACGSMNRFDTSETLAFLKDQKYIKEGKGIPKLPAYKTKIDGCIFVFPRFIPIILPAGTDKVGICERPLRADTQQGPRVSVCRSETVPPGSIIECQVQILSSELKPYVEAWLNYGVLRGLGQWRNSGKGRFTWEEIS